MRNIYIIAIIVMVVWLLTLTQMVNQNTSFSFNMQNRLNTLEHWVQDIDRYGTRRIQEFFENPKDTTLEKNRIKRGANE